MEHLLTCRTFVRTNLLYLRTLARGKLARPRLRYITSSLNEFVANCFESAPTHLSNLCSLQKHSTLW
ncbi:uncharacterized protein PHALS_13408 [Plasmopara halstedii]|uniref:Uncharacterized protein n=1 Tax=Plasmopara halstedii TaxID=4781 RepID=A0A0P1AQQ1_PLAHL|nr:uncharacterized protein PHALS_13408 [Plasmopara halstedii]CEG43194.1 hypothetical protein PHALS_13408 [Plasmopara halstedii]|eukprot:XP_024579563.1 hypothetical protein PHALS_13408 [Plasmopara halstedii]